MIGPGAGAGTALGWGAGPGETGAGEGAGDGDDPLFGARGRNLNSTLSNTAACHGEAGERWALNGQLNSACAMLLDLLRSLLPTLAS